jgi:hypothetical protein
VGVDAQRGGGVAVTEACLGLEDLTAVDEKGGDTVAEPVIEHADREPLSVGCVGGEDPGTENAAGG